MKPWHSAAALTWMEAVLQERYGLPVRLAVQDPQTLALMVEGQGDQYVTLALDGAAFVCANSDLPCVQWPVTRESWRSALGLHTLPAPGLACLPEPLIVEMETGLYIGYDILGLTYWMLNRIEEVGRIDGLDAHGRFPATASHAFRYGYLERPIVDEWLHVLGQVMQRVWPGITLRQHRFSMKVSHDVDSPSLYAFKSWKIIGRMMAGHLLKRRDFPAFCVAPYVKLASGTTLHPADPFNTFDWLMDQSERCGLTSAFYFICGRTSRMDADYEPEHPVIQDLLRRIHQRGHEIGLHPSYGTYRRPELIRQEAERLRSACAQAGVQQEAFGGRMHYLRWEQPTTLQAWNDAGMAYDSTLGYADRPGFRCGTCFEYSAFNPVTQQALALRVRPLVVMECTVMDPTYLGLGVGDDASRRFVALKEACRRVEGNFTLLWHNSSFQGNALKELYESCLVSEDVRS